MTYQNTKYLDDASNAGKGVIRVYYSVNGNKGDFIQEWIIPDSVWTYGEFDLSSLAGKTVFLYVGIFADCWGDVVERKLYIDELEIATTPKPFTTEGYIEAEFSFTHGFEGATIKQILLKVDYASEAEWTGFWGVRILDSGVEVASFPFTKGYMAWNTFSQDIKQYVAGKTVTIRIGGVITSAARWFIDNVRLEYVLEYPFLTLQLQPSYPANSWGNLTVLVGRQQSGVLVTAEIEGRGFQAVSDQNGVAVINVLMPPVGSYPIMVFATNPEDWQLYQVDGTVTVLPVIQARIEAEPSQHYDTPITFIVKTSDPDGNVPVDADTLSVEILMGGVRLTPTIERLATGEYQVSFTASQEGTVSVSVTPLKSGYHSVPDGVEIAVLQPRLVLTVNIPQEAAAPGHVEVYVKTTTPDGGLIDSTVTAILKHPDGTSRSYTASRVTRGTYLLVLSLPEAGVYQITVQASNDLYGSSSGTYTLTAKAQAVPFLDDVRVIGGAAAAAIAAIIAVLKRRGTI
jgi:hypothetical protein